MGLGEWVFFATELEGTLVIPATVTTIGKYAFEDTNGSSRAMT